MDELDLEAIKARADAAQKGPWRWYGSIKGAQVLYLATAHSGRRVVMAFRRWGMRSAQPMFNTNGLLVDGAELADRSDVQRLNHPDAEFIAHAREDVDALLARVAEQQRFFVDLQESYSQLLAAFARAEADRDEARREVATLAETNRRMNEGWANAEAAVQAETRRWAIDALRDRERWAKWCAERVVWEGMQTIDVRQPNDAADYLAARPDHSGGLT